MILPISQNHITYQAQERIRELVAPLAKMTDLHYFCYRVQYSDNTFFTLITHIDYFETWFAQQFRLCGSCCEQGWHQWDPTLPKYNVSREYGIDNGICYIKHHKDKTEIFSFGTHPENKISDFYLNELKLLKRFSFYFEREAQNIIRKAAHHRILLKYVTKQDLHSHHRKNESSLDNTIRHFHRDFNQPFSTMSSREAECYRFLIQGYSIKEISQHLNLAPTTINEYIANLKRKLGISCKKELVQLAYQSGLIEY